MWKDLSSPREIEKEVLKEVKRQRDRTRYRKRQQIERDRKRVESEAAKEMQDSAGDLKKSLDEGRYGPIFRSVLKYAFIVGGKSLFF